jgi:nucleotide-binding universal stress UspA family protein
MKTFIVALDGSERSTHALDVASKLAGPAGVRLLLVHVMEPIRLQRDEYAKFVADFEAKEQGETDKILDEAKQRAEASGVRAETRSLRGKIAESIAELAAAEKADLVVVGSHGHGAVADLFIGSVSDRLVHISPSSVLVAR